MKMIKASLFVAMCAILAGCGGARSISHSDYREPGTFPYASRSNGSDSSFEYRGELGEFDVLGVTRSQAASEADIQRALDNAKPIRLTANSSILLIQSGAMFPDGAMAVELGKYFRVNSFSGVPPASIRDHNTLTASPDAESFSHSLRLAAARGGNDVILCYWGILESKTENLATKTVSWVPVVNWVMPDEKLRMRIRLKLALVDVRTGTWSVLSPVPFDDSRITTSPRHGATDQKQVELLKAKAYQASVKDLLRRYSDLSIAGR